MCSGENSSKSSSDCSPEKELSVKTDRGQEMRKSAKFALQKNCTYDSGSDKSKSMKTTQQISEECKKHEMNCNVIYLSEGK